MEIGNCSPVLAWEGNWTHDWTWDCFVAFLCPDTRRTERGSVLVAVNYAPNQSQCYVQLPLPDGHWRLHDMLGVATCDREGTELRTKSRLISRLSRTSVHGARRLLC